MVEFFKGAVILLTISFANVLSHNQIVITPKGSVEGFMDHNKHRHVTIFLGIPYAKPPLAMRRFKPPEAADSWNDVMMTKVPKPACPQNKNAVTMDLGPNFQINETNEDCLYLNVYVPGKPKTAKPDPLPVMVFIHGGGFQSESGTVWDATTLARHANVVVVSMNFRLGVLGFLSTNDSAASGNWGLMDQRFALQWIQENIREFGGDKARVTIFGEGSGAYSVGLHILSPLSRGLFARAISQGGTITSPSLLTTDPMMRVKPLAMMAKCVTMAAMKSGDFHNLKVVECLRKVPVEELLKHDAMTPGFFTPVVDRHFIPDNPVTMLKSGKFPALDYIIGGNSNEGSNIGNKIPDFNTGPGLNKTDFEKYISNIFSLALPEPVPKSAQPALTAVISSKYFPRNANLNNFRRSYLDAVGEALTSKMFETVNLYSLRGKVYVFYFTHKPSESRFPAYVGPGYAEELPFLFGYALKNGTDEEKSLCLNWMESWGRFARTGNAHFNNGTLAWSSCETPSLSYLEITVNMTEQNLKTTWKTDVRRFWNIAIPEVAKLAQITHKCKSKKCNHLNWGVSSEEADAIFIVLILVSCFLFCISAGLTLILYKTNVQQAILAKRFLTSSKPDSVISVLEEHAREKENFKTADMHACHTKL